MKTPPSVRGALAELRNNRTVTTCAILLLLIAALALLGPMFSPYTVDGVDHDNPYLEPSLNNGHIFGTDNLGRDQFVRTMAGTRLTLLVALVASIVSLTIGVVYGAVAGFVGGKTDAVMMRAVDGLYAMPFIFFVILLMVVFERSFILIFVAIGAVNWLDTARIVRGQTLSLKQRAFVDAARMTGVSTAGIVFRHLAPNLLGVIIVYVTLTVPQVILFESFLSYLGLGVQAPEASLGTLVNDGSDLLQRAPWMLIYPATILALTLYCFNFLGDGLRDALDPKRKAR